MDFSRHAPADVLRPEIMADYNNWMLFFSLQLTRLNMNVFLLEKVFSFPFNLFSEPGGTWFFRMVIENFLASSILGITKLAGDQDSDAFTLPKFRNWLLRAVRPELVSQFRGHIKRLRFDSTVRTLLRKAIKVRDRQIAHSLTLPSDIPSRDERISFAEIKTLTETLSTVFSGPAFDTDYLLLPLEYSREVEHPPGADRRPDIERLLDKVAHQSTLLNLPKSNPERWGAPEASPLTTGSG